MYRLYKTGNGQVKQVPVNDPTEDQGIEEKFPNPLEAKGENRNEAPFVEQQRNQFDLIKQNETDQARFQTKKLQNSNYQIINFKVKPTADTTSQAFFFADYNDATVAPGSPMDDCVMFGTVDQDVTKSKYYNIVYANVRYGDNENTTSGNSFLLNPSYVEFYAMQKIPTGDFGGKIPRQIEAVKNDNNLSSLTIDGGDYGVQSFGVDVYNENAYYTQTPDLKGIRSSGIALKRIALNFDKSINISQVTLFVEIGIDLNTEGNNY
tara:strand:+ start:473 stop:1264 length:792 start_codon:yes stop_codon:yes gene_type:complete